MTTNHSPDCSQSADQCRCLPDVTITSWQPVAEGHTLPRISPPMRPLCGHAVYVPHLGGWSTDCDLPATLMRTTDEGRDIYACGPRHAQQIENEEGMQ